MQKTNIADTKHLPVNRICQCLCSSIPKNQKPGINAVMEVQSGSVLRKLIYRQSCTIPHHLSPSSVFSFAFLSRDSCLYILSLSHILDLFVDGLKKNSGNVPLPKAWKYNSNKFSCIFRSLCHSYSSYCCCSGRNSNQQSFLQS